MNTPTQAIFSNNAMSGNNSAARHEMRVFLGMLMGLILLPWILMAGGLTMTSVVDCVLLAMVCLGLNLLLGQLTDVPDARRGAAFHCAAAVVLPDGTERVVEGTIDGTLIREPRGSNGFGYDPIFVPVGESRTTAEMSAGEKDSISHRGRAMRALVPVLQDILR